MKSTTLLVSCLVVAGCAADELSFDTTSQQILPGDDGTGGGCPTWGCGSNTSNMGGIPFIDVSENTSEYNSGGFRIVRFEKKNAANVWQVFKADVSGAELLARDPANPTTIVLKGSQLVGGRFYMLNTNGYGYYLMVQAYGEMAYWAQADKANPKQTPIYRLQWIYAPSPAHPTPPVMHPQDICGANPDSDGPMADFYSVLFDSDQYDATKIRVVADRRNWFNIGCAGHAMAKLHLLGHTAASARAMGKSALTLGQRTAMLKMITADYCGGGNPFTVAGQPLKWKDANGWYDTVSQYLNPGPYDGTAELEARWNENGAICVNTPRVDHSIANGDPVAAFPYGVELLISEPQFGWCATRPPPCTGALDEMQGAHVISANFNESDL